MTKPLKNAYMEIVVHRDVVLGEKKYHPSDSLTAQATDNSHSTWHICCALGSSDCVVDRSELEQRMKDGLISFECT